MNLNQSQNDYEIIQNISSLVELEYKNNIYEDSFDIYKIKTKQLLQKLLQKLEDNFEYQLFLENEIKRFESSSIYIDQNKSLTTCEIEVDMNTIEEKYNESPIRAVIKNMNFNLKDSIEKDQIIEDLKEQLEDSRKEIMELKQLRNKESIVYKNICDTFIERIKILNNNFNNKTDDETY